MWLIRRWSRPGGQRSGSVARSANSLPSTIVRALGRSCSTASRTGPGLLGSLPRLGAVRRRGVRAGSDHRDPIWYDGPDVAVVARHWGVAEESVVARHQATEFLVAFGGFAPGFAYLTGLPPALAVPRLDTPRTRVPAGSVGLADVYCGIYPTASPGGWLLIGHTDAVLFDPERDPPALLTPGVRVRFVRAADVLAVT